jgi:hypothetical protein
MMSHDVRSGRPGLTRVRGEVARARATFARLRRVTAIALAFARPRRSAAIALAIASAALGACDDDATGPSDSANEAFAQRLTGDYTAETDSFGGILYWRRFSADGCHTLLTERESGLRSVLVGPWSVLDGAAGRIRIDGSDYTATLALDDSLLTLVSDHEGDTYVVGRAPGMPDPSQWLYEIQLVDSFAAANQDPTDLAWNGGLWVPGRAPGAPLVRLNPLSGLQTDSTLAVEHSGWAVASAGESFWVEDGAENRIYRVSTIDGSTQEALDYAPAAQVRGLAVRPDGKLWIGAGSRIVLVDTTSGDSVDAVEMIVGVDGLEQVGDALYVALGSLGIARIEGPPWRVAATYKLPGWSIRGLAFDGEDWWLYAVDARGNITTRFVRARLLASYLATPDFPWCFPPD